MASLFAHSAALLALPEDRTRRLALAALFCACWQDVDYASLLFEVRPHETFGHRGATHSLFVAAAVAAIVAFALFRARFRRVFPILFAVGASHGLLDALTAGDVGVALFWPLTSARFHFPFSLIASCPGGVDEWLGYWGILTLANELLYVVIPVALVVSFLRRPDRRRRVAMAGGAWLVSLVALRLSMPEDFTPTRPRVIEPIDTERAGRLADLPHDDLPNGELVTKLDALKALGLFDTTLRPSVETWSSNFFPAWFGSEGGRWADGAPKLAWRTLFGFSAPSDVHGLDTFKLSPTEKIDIALGRNDFPATNQALSRTHNTRPRPRYWKGRCNGVATASLAEPEPFRVVDVIGKDGTKVRFHPNDVKALLAAAYDDPESKVIGQVCTTVAFDVGATCSMNPAVLVVAALNRIGIAKKSFLIDALPTIAKQYYAVAAARVHVGTPKPVSPPPIPSATQLVDAEIELTLSSTTLPIARADVPESGDSTRYKRVGLVPVVMHYSAVLALAADGSLVGGKWTGDPADGPDDVLIVSAKPIVKPNGGLDAADEIPWSLVEKLAKASVDDGPNVPTVDLR